LQLEQLMRAGAARWSCARRLLVRRFEWRRLGFGMLSPDCGLRISDCGFSKQVRYEIRNPQSAIRNCNGPAKAGSEF
jgi:hypothetical protein